MPTKLSHDKVYIYNSCVHLFYSSTIGIEYIYIYMKQYWLDKREERLFLS